MVLMYHDVYIEKPEESGFISKGANNYKLNVGLFRKHLTLIKSLASDTVLTFDDGGVSFYNVIAPLLEEFGLKGHFFIATDYIGVNGFMNESQISDLHNRGHIIGAHSSSHPSRMTALSLDDRKKEWDNSISILSTIIGEPITEVSIPNGYYQKEDIVFLTKAGIKNVYTSSLSDCHHEEDGLNIRGRLALMHNTTPLRLKNSLVNPFFYIMIITKQQFLHWVKEILGDKYIIFKKKILH